MARACLPGAEITIDSPITLREGEVVYDGPSAALTPSRLQQLYGTQLEWAAGRPDAGHEPSSPHGLPALQAA